MMELHPSFYKVIRDQRKNDKVSDNEFIAAILITLTRNASEILPCGHGSKYSDNNECLVCKTKSQMMNGD